MQPRQGVQFTIGIVGSGDVLIGQGAESIKPVTGEAEMGWIGPAIAMVRTENGDAAGGTGQGQPGQRRFQLRIVIRTGWSG